MAASARDGRGRSSSYTGPSYSSNTGNASSANSSANNAASYASLVVFRVQVGEDFGHGEDVYVCGNTPSLGMFDPHRGVQLFASTASYPFFQSNVVPLTRGEAVEYKYAVFVGGLFDRFEAIDYNRCIGADELAQNTDLNMEGRMLGNSGDDTEIVTHTTNDALNVTPAEPPPPSRTSSQESMNDPIHGQASFGTHYTPANSPTANAININDGVIVVSYYLPVQVSKQETSSNGRGAAQWHVEWDHENLMSLKTQLRVTRIGTVRYPGGFVPVEERDSLVAALDAFNCVPIFLDPPDQHDIFFNQFCKQTLWPVFHNLLEIYGPVPTGQSGREAGKIFHDPSLTAAPGGGVVEFGVDEDGVAASPPSPTAAELKARAAAASAVGGGGMAAVLAERPVSPVSPLPSMGARKGSEGAPEGDWPPPNPLGSPGIATSLLHKIPRTGSAGQLGDEGGGGGALEHKDAWLSYTAVQKQFSKKIMEIYQEGDLVWIHGFHLMLLPSYFSRLHPAAKIGLFLHTPFPSSEIFRTLSRRQDILRGMLSADQVGFHLYEYARHFLTCCRRLLGLEWTHEANGINIHYGGRSVLVTCIHAGMDQEVIRSISEQPAVQADIAKLMQRSLNKTLFAGIDRMERLKGVPLKLLAFERFLGDHPEVASTVMLYEVSLSARERGLDYEQTKTQVSHLVTRINARFSSDPESEPVVVWEERDEKFFQLKDRLALLSTADVFFDTTVRGGLNRWPLEFVLAQSYMGGQGSEYLPKAKTAGLMVLSEFTSCMRVLQGALTVNPWKIAEVAEALWTCVSMPMEERDKRQQMDVEYVRVHTTASWCSRVLQDLKGVKKSNEKLDYVPRGLNNWAVTKMKRGFEQLDTSKVVRTYRKSKNRLILLDYGGTLYDDTTARDDIAHFQVSRGDVKRNSPAPKVIATLRELCKDTRNKVYVLSGKVRRDLVDSLGRVPGLGLVAEAGYFYRRPDDAPLPADPAAALASSTGHDSSEHWTTLVSNDGMSMSWKQVATAVMHVYMERTHGVYIQQNESAVVWQFRDADPEFAMLQSKELEDQLKGLLKHLNVEVIRGDDYIEARPCGVSKAAFIQNTLTELYSEDPPDFILCIGDDASDERSYKVVKQFVNLISKASKLHQTGSSIGSQSSGGSSIGSANSVNLISVPPRGNQPKNPPQYFTATVGMKPTDAENYLHQTDNVVDMLETMSKTRGIEHSISMLNFQSSNPTGVLSPPPATDSSNPNSPPLSSVPENNSTTAAASSSIGRSTSMPNFQGGGLNQTGRTFSSMMLSQYFDNIGTNNGDGNPDDDDFGLFIEEEGIEF